ncbi:MAG: DegT/DnrJ/EryC1/StrS family aminotransferase, partial [Thermoanaerobaculia bacterium]
DIGAHDTMHPSPETAPLDVPYLDLSRARARIAEELEARWRRVLETNAFVLGPEVREFEERFAAFLEVPACAAVANGTDALVLALRALGLRPGDEVLVPAFSFFATAEAVILLGGRPVFCDVEPETLNLDPRDAASRVTPRTVGIIGVHLYGRPFDVPAVQALCARHGLWLLEDAAQAQGARLDGKRVGGLGALASWSFYPTKNLACFGDGGAVSGPDRELVERVKRLANHGQTSRYHHVEVGTNSRLDSLQAAVLNCRLPRLDADNARRRELACRYHGGLAGLGDLRLLQDPPGAVSVYHQLTVRTARRDELAQHLSVRGVGSSVHYPSPLHRQPALAGLIPDPGELPVATAAAREVLCLPLYAELTDRELEQVCEAVHGFYR